MDLVVAPLGAFIGCVGGAVAGYVATRKKVEHYLDEQLAKISGNRLKNLAELVAAALKEERLRDTAIGVIGDESLWVELRKGGFTSSRPATPQDDYDVVVVDADSEAVTEDTIATLKAKYVLIYTVGRFGGSPPPGALVTFANTPLTLEARLLQLLKYRAARN